MPEMEQNFSHSFVTFDINFNFKSRPESVSLEFDIYSSELSHGSDGFRRNNFILKINFFSSLHCGQ